MNATVLVVDDDADVADVYAGHLGDAYDVRVAYGGHEALDRLDESVDVVLLDRRMPRLDGDEVLDRIRERDYDVRVAMVTAVDPDFDIVDVPFDAYLTKPATRADLVDVVERLIRRATYSETLRRYYALVATRATLEAEKTRTELAANDAYAALTSRIEAIAVDLDSLPSAEPDDGEWAALIDEVSNS